MATSSSRRSITTTVRTVAIRRPLIDEVLLDAVRKESRIRLEAATVAGLIEGTRNGVVSSVAGVATADGRAFKADLVIDAAGRRSPMPAELEAIGATKLPTRTTPCGFLAYGRYFETRPDVPLPPKVSPQVVRASLGYLQGGAYWQDARVIVVGLWIEADDRDLRIVHTETAFMAACRSIKALSTFVDPSFAMPVSGVVSIGGLHNVRRRFAVDGTPVARGFAAIGDGLCHTNPTPAYGMSLALDQAVRLPDLVREAGPDVGVALEEAVGDELDERYEHVSSSDAIRMAFAHGRPPDLEQDREFLAEVGTLLVAAKDPGVLRRYFRRALALDKPSAMTSDDELMDEARAAIIEGGALERTPKPTRTDLLRALAEAV